VVSAVHQAADALARVAVTDTAAAKAGRLFVPTRSLSARHDIPRAFTPARPGTVRDLHQAYHGAADASGHAMRRLDELAIVVAAPSKVLGLARAAALVPSRPGSHATRPDGGSRQDQPGTGMWSGSSTRLPGAVEQALRQRHIDDPALLLRAAAIGNEASALLGLAENADMPRKPGSRDTASSVRDAIVLAAESFPHDPVAGEPATPSRPGTLTGGPASEKARPRRT
jgi:hypothetical protein